MYYQSELKMTATTVDEDNASLPKFDDLMIVPAQVSSKFDSRFPFLKDKCSFTIAKLCTKFKSI